MDIFSKSKDDSSIIISENDNSRKDFIFAKDNIIKTNNINFDNFDKSSIELSLNSGSMDTISKKNFIPKIDLMKNCDKISNTNTNSPSAKNSNEDVK